MRLWLRKHINYTVIKIGNEHFRNKCDEKVD